MITLVSREMIMRFAVALLAAMLVGAPVNAATVIIHSGDNPWAYIWKDYSDGTEHAYFEADYNGFIDGPYTVRFDVQGGQLKAPAAALESFYDIYYKVANRIDAQFVSHVDSCGVAGCKGTGFGNAPDFITDFTFGNTFMQYSFNAPKSYYKCNSANKPGVCGELWSFQDWFYPELIGNGPKSFSVTYSGKLRPYIPWSPPVPEPASWMMMIAGFGAVGASMRRRRHWAVS